MESKLNTLGLSQCPCLGALGLVGLLLALLPPLQAATPVTDISLDNRNADEVGANLQRQKRLESLFSDWQSPEWVQAYRRNRDRWFERIGLDLGATYDMAGLAAYGGGDPDYGLSGDLTVNGMWLLTGKKWDRPLNLNFRFRDRFAIGGRSASEVAGATGGVIWNLIDGFSNAGFEVPDFHFVQHLPRIGMVIRYGQMTIDSQFDGNGLQSSKQAFFNRAFSSNPAVAFPRFGAGAVATWTPENSGFDFTLGATNVQGTQNGEQVDFKFASSDFFTAAQVGRDFNLWNRPARAQFMVWHSDGVDSDQTPAGSGASLTFERWIASSGNRVFVRGAWADGEATDADRLVSAGIALERRENDLFGVAAGFGRGSSGNHEWQMVIESFYRWQIGPMIQISPEAQIVFGEGMEPSHPFRLVAGLRAQISF